ncbi:DUF554 domain-containing protein [Desulfitobacterium sp. THU1]|uniref:DUF554 domain-containing protein n=1 Tax=Desulfitobacterium sp. THU1 TaxID=3138072 RepID=UPI00311D38F2
MLGTIVNSLAIIIGAIVGILFGKALPEKIKRTVTQGIGLAVILIGLSMALETQNPIVVIASLVLGGILGEWIDIELRLQHLGLWLERKFAKGGAGGNFTKGFVSSSLMFCVGAMAIMGALESGLKGVHDILYAKSMLDGISSIVLASSMGIGVLVSAIPVFLYQGGITVSAGLLQSMLSEAVIAEMSATGGLLIVGIGLTLLEIKEIKVGNLLPGIFVAIPLTLFFAQVM